MTVADPPLRKPSPASWLFNQPYLMLSLMSLFWAMNIVLGRFVAGHVPPFALTFCRWAGTALVILPFAWPYLVRDWPVIRRNLPLLLLLAFTGFAFNNALSYWGLQHTQALNALLIQSSGPLFVALWSLMLFGVRLSWMQAAGIVVSLLGVLVIVLRGDLAALAAIQVNAGDISFAAALFVFGLYSALMPKRPRISPLSLIAFTTGTGAVMLLPLVGWEVSTGEMLTFDTLTVSTIVFVVLFPSTLAYIFYNRGIELIGPNRAAPFFHLVPVFGSVMAIMLLGEKPELFHLVGYVLVLAGIFTASRRGSAGKRPAS
ncbi:DMT family transporter [Afipia massiliensis]|uniref:DMT family transporter n=1 Tax=Afipia massiliensis TaxID=211460 RepID=A0A4U6BQ39_9BRAD|nr:DMT family transporter [Afipia massiliensis]TKT72001.1 DMT family transporter [Afipia massiliensis]